MQKKDLEIDLVAEEEEIREIELTILQMAVAEM